VIDMSCLHGMLDSVSLIQSVDVAQLLHWHLPLDLAQQFKDPDFAGDIGRTWNHFVKTGQLWAFLGGLILGYLVKTFTSFG